MATNTVKVTLQIRNDTAAEWTRKNPVLGEGEYGLEKNTFLLKIGDGIRDWAHLPYLNKLNSEYFKQTSEDGTITFSDSFAETINNIIANAGGNAHLVINDDPEVDTDPIAYGYLRQYVSDAIAAAGHLKRAVVQELPSNNIDENTIYMVPSSSGIGYEEYMYIQGTWDMVGNTADSSGYVLPVATTARLGGVKAIDPITNPGTEYLSVTNEGFMTLNNVSTSRLYVPTGDTLVIYGGTA